ncbi:uncharacterized protein [Spinacia oleracea]|uniref:Granulins domain-containing protein n=1 Tax=Spinacia oleracea TaxID=3562 RepID=A0ABM3R7I8_SPIOL|nr:uncharacterized protein LOC130467185 [Spinacia oleracea]
MGRKDIQLAGFLFLATVMMQMVYVNACIIEGGICTATPGECCQTPKELSCWKDPTDPTGIRKICTNCESHPGHPCIPGERECCTDSGLTCANIGGDNYECKL